MGTAIKHLVPDRVKPVSFVIFDIRATAGTLTLIPEQAMTLHLQCIILLWQCTAGVSVQHWFS